MKTRPSIRFTALVTAVVCLLAVSGRPRVLAEEPAPAPGNGSPGRGERHERGAVAAALLKAAQDPSPDVRAAAVNALGDLQIRSAVPLLITLLEDPRDFVSDAAAGALSVLGDPSAVPALIAKLKKESKALEPPAAGTGGFIISTSTNSVPNELRQQEFQREIATVRALAALRDPRATDVLQACGLKSSEISVQMAAALALGKIGGPQAAQALEEILAGCYRSLPQAPSTQPPIEDRSAPASVRALQQQQAYFRNALTWSLGEIGKASSLPVLRQALQDPNSFVRENADEAIDKIHRRQAR